MHIFADRTLHGWSGSLSELHFVEMFHRLRQRSVFISSAPTLTDYISHLGPVLTQVSAIPILAGERVFVEEGRGGGINKEPS